MMITKHCLLPFMIKYAEFAILKFWKRYTSFNHARKPKGVPPSSMLCLAGIYPPSGAQLCTSKRKLLRYNAHMIDFSALRFRQ